MATVDNRGRVYATHVRQNRYALLANVHHAGTAMTFGRAATKSSVFVAFADRTVRVFDTTSSATATLAGHRCAVTALSVSPDGRLLVSQSKKQLRKKAQPLKKILKLKLQKKQFQNQLLILMKRLLKII